MVVKLKSPADTGSNKPHDFLVQLIAQAYWYVRPTKYRVEVLKPVIDRLAVTYPVPSVADQASIRDRLASLANDPSAPTVAQWGKQKKCAPVKYARYYGVGGSFTQAGQRWKTPKRYDVDAAFEDHDHELYDLQEDPHELVNLANDRSRRGELRDWFERLAKPEATEFAPLG